LLHGKNKGLIMAVNKTEVHDYINKLWRTELETDIVKSVAKSFEISLDRARNFLKQYKRYKGIKLKESKFEMYLESLQEGRGDKPPAPHYKVKKRFDTYDIVGGSLVVRVGIKDKKTANEICTKMNKEFDEE
jgi:hypothetical protein